jgi:hypothetical protein
MRTLEELIMHDAQRVVPDLLHSLETYAGAYGYGISNELNESAQELLGNIDRWFINRGGRDTPTDWHSIAARELD